MVPAYRMGKGPVVVALEEFLASDEAEVWYKQLVDEETYGRAGARTKFDDFLEAWDPGLYDHVHQDVFGPGRDPDEIPPDLLEDAKQQGAGRRLVYYRGLRRAMEIAYGFDGVPKGSSQRWTIHVLWACGQTFNGVSLGTDAVKRVVDVILYSDQAAMGDDGRDVVARDESTAIDPDPAGDLYFVDDRNGVGSVCEWRATRTIGFAASPPAPPAPPTP